MNAAVWALYAISIVGGQYHVERLMVFSSKPACMVDQRIAESFGDPTQPGYDHEAFVCAKEIVK
jgi:hypothetical protein